jgi:hypothetical protein
MAGATGLEPATFGVTGRTNSNEINDRCEFRGGQSATETAVMRVISVDYHAPAG